MQRKLLVIAPILLSVGLVAFLANLYFKSLNMTITLDEANNLESTIPTQIDTGHDEWVLKFAQKSKKGFEYPATELQIKLDLMQQLKEQTVYRVMIDDMDEYKFFCINQILKAKGIKYSYFRSRGFIKLIVTAKDEEYLKSVLSQLKDYNINYKIEQTLIKG